MADKRCQGNFLQVVPLGTEEPYYSIRITHGFLFVVGIPKPKKPRLCVAEMIPPTANFEFTETTVRKTKGKTS
jgi:hypothetical protein